MDYLVAFWNLENLFAPEGYPEREPWLADRLRNDLRGWTPELFERKVAQLASIIARMGDGQGPDLLGVCEVENRHALQALAERLNALLPERAYDIIHVDAEREQRGIDTAFITDGKRLKPRRKELFSHWVMRRTGTRDITQCTFVTAAGNELIALANHWPSRSAPAGRGPQYSAGFRATAGETLGYWHERIREVKGPDAAVLAMGDFNDDPFDASLTIHAGATREQGDVARAQSARFYNLSWRYLTQAAVDHRGKARDLDGTLYFSGDGNVFDQILVARGLLAGSGALRARVESAHRSLSGDGGPSSRRRADPLRPAQGRRRAQRECGWLQRPLPGIRAHRRSGLSRRRSEPGRRRDHGHGLCAPRLRARKQQSLHSRQRVQFSDFELRYISTHNDAPSGDRPSFMAWTGPQQELLPDAARRSRAGATGRGTSCVRVSSWPRHCALPPFSPPRKPRQQRRARTR